MIHPNALWAVVLIMSTPRYLLTNVCRHTKTTHKPRHPHLHGLKTKQDGNYVLSETIWTQRKYGPQMNVKSCCSMQCFTSVSSYRFMENVLWSSTGESVVSCELGGEKYLVGVRPVLVFGSVRGVGEGFVASFVLADIRFLSRVRAQMGFEVFETGVGLRAALELKRNQADPFYHNYRRLNRQKVTCLKSCRKGNLREDYITFERQNSTFSY